MTDLDEPRDRAGTRTTLKLKTPVGKRAPVPVAPAAPSAPAVTPPAAAPKYRGASKTVDWADEHKQRMQADMDALSGAKTPNDPKRGR